MLATKEEQSGQLVLTNILGAVWLGDWSRYEEIFEQMPETVKENFPFHMHYERENVALWHENYFQIPGDYFISPYYSSYLNKKDGGEEGKHDLLCLISMYEKLGFYFPLERSLYPDHVGCLTAFLGAILQEKIAVDEEQDIELYQFLFDLEKEISSKFIQPVIENMHQNSVQRIEHPFFAKFLQFNFDVMQEL